jgi:Aconitase family (aconitate hydratase)
MNLRLRINKAYLVSCTNSRASDLAAAAKVFKDAAVKNNGNIPKIADGVKFYIAAASIPEQKIAEETGDWQALVEAGAQTLPAGCGPCIGLSNRERWVSVPPIEISKAEWGVQMQRPTWQALKWLQQARSVERSVALDGIRGHKAGKALSGERVMESEKRTE